MTLAAGVRLFGAKAVIYFSKTVPQSFAEKIKSYGAEVVIVGDNYEFIAGSDYVNVKGDVNITIEGNAEVLVKEDYNIRCSEIVTYIFHIYIYI